jgi:aryl-alcohol dehydrogenase-like predicted oxidoreductase
VKQRKLGGSGARVSAVGLGCNAFGGRLDVESSRKVVHAALDLGINLFDTSDSYGETYGHPGGSEMALGEILGDRRKDIILATKFGHERSRYDACTKGGASRRTLKLAVEGSLKRLKTDWIDLYQMHKPDPLTPIEETLRALDDLVKQGKVLYIGCSNFPAWRVVEAHWTARHLGLNAFVTCEDEYSLLVRSAEAQLIPAMQAHGLGLLPYFPLAAGMLTGKYNRDAPPPDDAYLGRNKRWAARFLKEENWTRLERLQKFCVDRGCTLVQLAFGWLLARPVVSSVIAGATKPGQVKANVEAADWAPTAEDMAEIDRLLMAG